MKNVTIAITTFFISLLLFAFIYNHFLKPSLLKEFAIETQENALEYFGDTITQNNDTAQLGLNLINYYHWDIIYSAYTDHFENIFKNNKWLKHTFAASIKNNSLSSKVIRLEAVVADYSNPVTQEFAISPNSIDTIGITPHFISSAVQSVEEVTRVNLEVEMYLVDANRDILLRNDVFKVDIAPASSAVYSFKTSTGRVYDMMDYLAVRVTPNTPRMQSILSTAASLHPFSSLGGYQLVSAMDAQDYVRSQVKAVYDALSKRDIYYVSNPVTFAGSQKVKFPSEVLSTGNANCIEATLLFASVLEALGIDPIIVTIPGHAFLGWKTWKYSDNYEFLEVSLAWNRNRYSFEDALIIGFEQYEEQILNNRFQTGQSRIVDISKAREKGITPFSFSLF